MDVMIRGENLTVTDGIREYTEKKLDKLDRYLPNIAEIRVDLSRQKAKRGGNTTVAQITLRHQRGAILRAEERLVGEDRDTLQAVVNMTVDKMYRRIERFKGKTRKSRKGRERFMATVEELELSEDIPEEEYEEYPEPQADPYDEEFTDIVRRKDVSVSPMTEIEAIDQMELLGHAFFMFYNIDTNSINVLYRRDIGGYGVRVPNLA